MGLPSARAITTRSTDSRGCVIAFQYVYGDEPLLYRHYGCAVNRSADIVVRMARTPQQIFDHHLRALLARDVEELLADYTDDSALITPAGVAQGLGGIRAAFSQLSAALADAVFDIKSQTYHGDMLLLEWTLDSPGSQVDGVDTFLFDDDSIRVQTISQTVRPKG